MAMAQAYHDAAVERWQREPLAIEQLVAKLQRLHAEKVELQRGGAALIERANAAEARAEQAEEDARVGHLRAMEDMHARACMWEDEAKRLRSRLATVEAALLHRCVVQRVEPTCEDCQTIIAALAATPAAEHVDLIPPMPARESFDATIVIDEFRRGTPHIYVWRPRPLRRGRWSDA